MKKFWVYFSLGLSLFAIFTYADADLIVYANSALPSYHAYTTENYNMRAEQTEWRFRVVDGKLQKRLWSKTYDKWLTEWEWV